METNGVNCQDLPVHLLCQFETEVASVFVQLVMGQINSIAPLKPPRFLRGDRLLTGWYSAAEHRCHVRKETNHRHTFHLPSQWTASTVMVASQKEQF